MSHVDEGALHAYLDGALDEYPSVEADRIRAHLDACAECAERLEVERRIRSDAHDLLGLAAPDVDVPSFEELRAYVQRTRRQRKGLGRLQRLGWAASIVVALGAGWMLREGQVQSRALDIGRQGAPAPEPVSEFLDADGVEAARMRAPRPEADAFGGSPDVSRQAGVGEAGTVASEGGRGEAVEARSRRLPADGTRGAAELAGADEVGASADRGTPRPETVDVVATPPIGAGEPAVELPTEAVDMPADAVEVLADVDEAPAGADQVAQEAPVARTDDTTAAAAGAAWRGQVAERVVPPVPAPDAVRPVASALGVTRREAFGNTRTTLPSDSIPSEPLLAVPGYEVLSVVNLGDGTTPWGVRVRQRTGDGRVFEVFHLEEGADPSIVPDEGDGAGEVRAETAGGWVLIRGPLSERELAELLGSLFPGDS